MRDRRRFLANQWKEWADDLARAGFAEGAAAVYTLIETCIREGRIEANESEWLPAGRPHQEEPDPMPKPIFITLPSLDIEDYARYLRERGWRLELDDTMEFGYLCFSPDDDPPSSGRRFRDAVLLQSELDLSRHFEHLFATHYQIPPPPPQEGPDAEHPAGQPG